MSPQQSWNISYPKFRYLGGHAQSILPKVFARQLKVHYQRQWRPDRHQQSQVAYDFVNGDIAAPLVVLFTGLEGSSHSHYARILMHEVAKQGLNGVVIHFRGLGGQAPTPPQNFYHAADYAEIAYNLHQLKQQYTTIWAVGVSLGGNMLAHYLAHQLYPDCAAAAIVSTPFLLNECANSLARPFSHLVYDPYFLQSLIPKALAVTTDQQQQQRLKHCRSLADFDRIFTAPRHGFTSLSDYYQRASSLTALRHIVLPTLLLNAQNDPFYPATALPNANDVGPHCTLMQPKEGGHAGFITVHDTPQNTWLAKVILDFFHHHSATLP